MALAPLRITPASSAFLVLWLCWGCPGPLMSQTPYAEKGLSSPGGPCSPSPLHPVCALQGWVLHRLRGPTPGVPLPSQSGHLSCDPGQVPLVFSTLKGG